MFKKYMRKPLVVNAIKWDGSERVLKLIRHRAGATHNIPNLTEANIGDYIIIGDPHSYRPDIFKKTYTEIKDIDHECAGCLYFAHQYITTYIPYLETIEENKKPACCFGGRIRTITTKYRSPLWCPIK